MLSLTDTVGVSVEQLIPRVREGVGFIDDYQVEDLVAVADELMGARDDQTSILMLVIAPPIHSIQTHRGKGRPKTWQ